MALHVTDMMDISTISSLFFDPSEIGSSPAGDENSPKVSVPPETGWAALVAVVVDPPAVVGAALLPLLLLHAPATMIKAPATAASDRARWRPPRVL